MITREMYEVHSEWQTRVCPVGVASLTRQFRRYFDRFEGRIREPPFAVYDDLAYTQGKLPVVKRESFRADQEIESLNGGIVSGPNLEEYRERLRGFAIDLGKDDEPMTGVAVQEDSADLGELYNFPVLQQLQQLQQSTSVSNFDDPVDHSVFASLDPFTYTVIPDSQTFQSTTVTSVLSPFDLGSIQTVSSQHSVAATTGQNSEDIPQLLFEDTDFGGFENFDDMFGDMPDMPGLDGAIDQGFLEFLDTTQS
jgi:hypothetical protein